MRRTFGGLVALVVIAGLVAGCGSSATSATSATTSVLPAGSAVTSASSSGARPEMSTTPAPSAVLRILVTNDDGVGAVGIDAVVEGLRMLPDTEVVVVAPAANQSGTGGKTTDGPLTAIDSATASGYRAKAVMGFPADTIVWAIDQHGIDTRPHLVVSGINIGQNIGPLSELSGTVGAARAAAQRGIPSLAASQGIASTLDFPSGVKLVIDWVAEHRADLLGAAPVSATTPGSVVEPATVMSINVPTCVTGTLRELVVVPTAVDAEGRDMSRSDCETPAMAPKDDVDAFIHGYPSLSTLASAAS